MRRSGLSFVVASTVPCTTRGPARVSEGEELHGLHFMLDSD